MAAPPGANAESGIDFGLLRSGRVSAACNERLVDHQGAHRRQAELLRSASVFIARGYSKQDLYQRQSPQVMETLRTEHHPRQRRGYSVYHEHGAPVASRSMNLLHERFEDRWDAGEIDRLVLIAAYVYVLDFFVSIRSTTATAVWRD